MNRIDTPMSLVSAKEECTQAVMDLYFSQKWAVGGGEFRGRGVESWGVKNAFFRGGG